MGLSTIFTRIINCLYSRIKARKKGGRERRRKEEKVILTDNIKIKIGNQFLMLNSKQFIMNH